MRMFTARLELLACLCASNLKATLNILVAKGSHVQHQKDASNGSDCVITLANLDVCSAAFKATPGQT